MFSVNVSAYTDRGDVRRENQDRILCRYEKLENHFIGMFIVADGCGGLEHGEAASSMAISHFEHFWAKLIRGEFNEQLKSNAIESLLDNTIKQINDACRRYAAEFGGKTGSTLSLLFTVDDKYYIKNLGDSRIYKKTLFGLKQLTEDQNIVTDMLRTGQLTRRGVKSYKKKNVLTMCIGYYERAYPYSARGCLRRNDTFLLCSDGLYNYLDIKKVNKILKSGKIRFSQKAEALRKSIPHGNARDNVSCIIARYV